MKPNFALSLSFDGIALLHRALPGWHLVGEVALDSADLAAELAELRGKARTLDPMGLRSKLVIPEGQIRYLDIAAGDATGADLAREVRAALDGATPYALDELVYDWAVAADRVQIAAVARETLDEAEAFAQEHGFNPVSFVARPQGDRFVGEPFFGPSRGAEARGDEVTPDPEAIRVIGAAQLPDAALPGAAAAPASRPRPADATSPVPASPVRVIPVALDPVQAAAPPAAADADADADAAPAVAFSSVRARGGTAPGAAPRLSGAARTDPVGPGPRAGPDAAIAASLRPIPEDDRPAPRAGTGVAPPRAAAPHRVAPAPVPHPGPAAASDRDETQRMTIFGARETDPTRGKPRYLGLILTVVLLLLMVGVAALASILSEDGLTRLWRGATTELAETPPIAGRPDPAAAPPPDAGDDTGPDVGTAPPATPDPEPAVSARIDLAAPVLVPAVPPATPAETATTSPAGPDAAQIRAAAIAVWQEAPEPPKLPAQMDLDSVYQTSIDVAVTLQDAVALPVAASMRPDARPPTPAVPAAAGTTFDIDQRGLVRATPEGAANPQGVRIRSGPPPSRPPSRPLQTRLTPALIPAVAERLTQTRPRLRPADLSEQNERGSLGGRTRTELASLRPQPRPVAPVSAAASDTAAIAAAVSAAATQPDPDAQALPQAVDRSLKPAPRPGNLDTRAVARQSRTAAATTPGAAASTASTAAMATSPARQQTVTPRTPTRITVARAATERNVLNMRDVNLIGVYGTPGSRRALVRLANGRYMKVQVGDRLDGGQVAAIGDSELRYIKRGQNVVLRLPRG